MRTKDTSACTLSILLLSASALLTGCGGDSRFFRQFETTPPLWKNLAAEPDSANTTEGFSTAIDADGTVWQSLIVRPDNLITPSEPWLRKLSPDGTELWRKPLATPSGWITPTPTGAVLLQADNGIAAYDSDGDLLWQANPLPAANRFTSLRTGTDGTLLLSSISQDRYTVNTVMLSADGTVIRKRDFPSSDEINQVQWAETADESSVLIVSASRLQDERLINRLTTRVIDSNGNVGLERTVSESDTTLIRIFVNGGDLSIQTLSTLYRLANDGSVQWQYAPANPAAGHLLCSLPTVDSAACAYTSGKYKVSLDLLTPEGTVQRHVTLNSVDQPVSLLGDATGRWALMELRAPDERTPDWQVYLNLQQQLYATYRAHILDENGAETHAINLLSAKATPPYVVVGYSYPMTIHPDFEYFESAALVDDRLFIAGQLAHQRTDLTQASVQRIGFVGAYSLE